MRTEGTGTDMTYHSKNRQGELLLNMVGKKENTAFMQLFCPLQSINTLIPPGEHRKNKIRLDNNASDLSVYLSSIYCYLSSIIEFELFWLSPPPWSGVDVGIRLNFTTDQRFFVTKTATIKPKLHVKEIRLYVMACLLEPESLVKVHQRLASGCLELAYLADVCKSYSVETGHLQVR